MVNIVHRDPFDELFRGFFVRPVEFGSDTAMPSVKLDVRETKEGYLVEAELPGIKKEDIHVQVEGDTVSISAERKQENEVKEGERILRTERSYGKISRTFQLSQALDEERASAKYNDGVLELTLPLKAQSATRHLTIA